MSRPLEAEDHRGILDALSLAAGIARAAEEAGASVRTVRAELERLYLDCAVVEPAMAEPGGASMDTTQQVEEARRVLADAERDLSEVQERHAAELATAVASCRAAQAAADQVHRAALNESAVAWSAHAAELAEQAAAAGDDVQTVTGVVLRGDGTAEPYLQLVFARDVLAGRAAEAQAKAARLREFAAPGGLQSEDLARVVDEQSHLPMDEMVEV
jgi:hypothetical protein